MVGFFGGILKLILVVVALLSGALSIFREFQLMYRPPAVPQKSVLWGVCTHRFRYFRTISLVSGVHFYEGKRGGITYDGGQMGSRKD